MARTSSQQIFTSFASFPSVGWSNILYIATDSNTLYRWNGSAYVAIWGGTATTATNLAGWSGGSIPYQSAAGTTAMLANWTAGQVLTSAGTTLAPTWTTISGFSWGSSITGTSWTGSLLTMWSNYGASGIWQSIILDNTQTQKQVLLSLNTGTSAYTHTWIRINSDQDSVASKISINRYVFATTVAPTVTWYGIAIWENFNLNSSFDHEWIFIRNEINAGSWRNTGLSVVNFNTTDVVIDPTGSSSNSWIWAGMRIWQSWVDWVALAIWWKSSVNSSTNWLLNITISNTQTGATVMQKINLGSSAQAHSAYYATWSNASNTAKAFNAAMATGYTGFLFHGSLNAVDKCTIDYNGDYIGAWSIKTWAPNGWTAGAWKTGIYVWTWTSVFRTDAYVELDIGGTLYKLALCTNS